MCSEPDLDANVSCQTLASASSSNESVFGFSAMWQLRPRACGQCSGMEPHDHIDPQMLSMV